jgi:hypothetical protein
VEKEKDAPAEKEEGKAEGKIQITASLRLSRLIYSLIAFVFFVL